MKIQYFKQETIWTCGAAAMRMALSGLGIRRSEKQVIKLLKTNKIRGTWTKNFIDAAEKLKLNYVFGNSSGLNELNKLLKERYKIIICYYIKEDRVDHYAVVDRITEDYIYLLDPWYGEEYKLKIRDFDKNWNTDIRWENHSKWFIALKK